MINIEKLKVEWEETDKLISNYDKIRLEYARTGIISEGYFSLIDDRLDLRKLFLNFLDTKKEIAKISNDDLKGQIEYNESYYEN